MFYRVELHFFALVCCLKSNLCQNVFLNTGAETEACLEGQFECPFSVASTAATGPRSYFHSFLTEDLSAVQIGG